MTLKRRVAAAASPEDPAKTQKRRRVSTYVPETDETADATTKAGLEVLQQIKEATDKHGRLIATEFLDLPDASQYPEYYKAIRLPISLNIIEKRLQNHEYTSMTPLESDLRRMVSNAKFYNEKGSLVFSNAERIRKIISGSMPKINPAYKDPNYAPFATPVPDADGDGQGPDYADAQPADPEPEPEPSERPQSRSRSNRLSTMERDTDGEGNAEQGFEGLKFEEAQEKIISEMIRLKDADEEEVFLPFINKPDKNLYREYYDIIQHPTSLRAILRQVRGTDRRKSSTQKGGFKSWQSFEDEVSYLWKNARIFNEEGSDIVRLAGALEKHFHERLAEAKRAVPEPPTTGEQPAGPRIKLRMGGTRTPDPPPQKLTLKLPGRQDESKLSRQNGVTIDTEALRRQQAVVRAGSNGSTQSTPARNLRDRSGSGARPPSSLGRHMQTSEPPPPATNGPTPAPQAATSTPTPKPETSVAPTPASASPAVNGTPTWTGVPNFVSGLVEAASSQHTQAPSPPPTVEADAKLKPTIRELRHALIRKVDIRTNPALNLQRNFHLPIPPSPTNPVQNITISLPSSHHVISITPTYAASSLQRQTQLTVAVEGQRIGAAPAATLRGSDTTTQRYDIRLGVGINRIDIEAIAAPARGLAHLALRRGPGVEYERITIFANLMRTQY